MTDRPVIGLVTFGQLVDREAAAVARAAGAATRTESLLVIVAERDGLRRRVAEAERRVADALARAEAAERETRELAEKLQRIRDEAFREGVRAGMS